VYDPNGDLRVYDTITGHQLADLPSNGGNRNRQIVVDGRITLPKGNANCRQTTGVFDIWRSARK